MSFQLSENWAQAWKWAANHFTLVLTAAPVAYVQWQGLQAWLSPGWFAAGMVVLGVASVLNTIREKP
jgi:hypothetical protein